MVETIIEPIARWHMGRGKIVHPDSPTLHYRVPCDKSHFPYAQTKLQYQKGNTGHAVYPQRIRTDITPIPVGCLGVD